MKKTILIIHEIYGITENLRKLAALLESEGFKVILPALYTDNYTGTNEVYSYKRFFANVGIEKGIAKIDELIRLEPLKSVILLGFSIGATLAWLKSTDSKLKGAIGVYGSRIRYYTALRPVVPTKLLFYHEKSFDAAALIGKLKGVENVSVEYTPEEHGFYSKKNWSTPTIRNFNKKLVAELNLMADRKECSAQ